MLFVVSIAIAEEPKKGFILRMWDKAKAAFTRTQEAETLQVKKKEEPAREIIEEEEFIEEEKPETDREKEKKTVQRKERTKEEKIEIIERRLEVFPVIMDFIPGLGMRQEEDGEARYYYAAPNDIAKELRELDEETISKLYVRVNQEATKIHTERILKQIQQQQQQERLLRNIQNIPRQPVQSPAPPKVPPSTPGVMVPVAPPKVPSAPPKAPTLPPSVPDYSRR